MISYPIITPFTYSGKNPVSNLYLLIIHFPGISKVNNISRPQSFIK
jgi:hypothetical protein